MNSPLTDLSALEILRVFPDGVLIVAAPGNIVWVNRRAEEIFGYAASELAGQMIEMLLPVDLVRVHEQHRALYTAKPTTRAMGTGIRLVGRRKNGALFRVEVSLSPVTAAAGLQIICTVRDLSEYLRV